MKEKEPDKILKSGRYICEIRNKGEWDGSKDKDVICITKITKKKKLTKKEREILNKFRRNFANLFRDPKVKVQKKLLKILTQKENESNN